MDERALKKIPLFSSLRRKERALVARHADEVAVDAGTELTVEGRLAYEFFVILEGRARVTQDGTEVNEMGPNEFFGEIGVLGEEGDYHRTATVTAITPMRLLVMFGPEFSAVADSTPDMQDEVRRVLRERLATD